MSMPALLLGLALSAGRAAAGDAYGPPLAPPEGEAGAPATAPEPDPTAARLLGEPPGDAPPSAASPADSPVGGVQVAVAMLLVGALAVAWGLRARSWSGGGGPALRVGARVPLGPGAHLAVVELQDGPRLRRMLVGYGGGSPALVAELADGAAEAGPARGFPELLRAARRTAPVGAAAAPPAAPAPAAGGPSAARRPAEGAPLARRNDLIAEVLAERGPEARPAPARPSLDRGTPDRGAPDRGTPDRPPVATAGGDPDDPGPPAETYTFRGLIG